MVKKLTALLLLQLMLSTPVAAAQYVVYVHGIVCEFCSFGVAKKIRKLDFIDSTQLNKGVKVEIESQKVFLAVREDTKFDKQALFNAIESGGYKPVTLWYIDSAGELNEVAQ